MGPEFEDQYADYAAGKNLTNRMPLFVRPSEKLSLTDVFSSMRNHFEGSALAFDKDVGSGPFNLPYRWRPLTWDYEGSTYVNERAIGTQQTGWNFVASIRGSLPTPLQAVLWFGADDSATTVRVPFYASATMLPDSFVGKGPQDGVVPPMMSFSLESAFYVTNLVSNWCYTRWSEMYPVVLAEIKSREAAYITALGESDARALAHIGAGDHDAAISVVNGLGMHLGDTFTKEVRVVRVWLGCGRSGCEERSTAIFNAGSNIFARRRRSGSASSGSSSSASATATTSPPTPLTPSAAAPSAGTGTTRTRTGASWRRPRGSTWSLSSLRRASSR